MSSSLSSLSQPQTPAPQSGADRRPETENGFTEIDGRRYACIDQLEQMPVFFLSMVSAGEHWLFASSNGALSAGRGSPDHALFPYYTVDKIVDNWNSTGPQTIIRCEGARWEPFKPYTKQQFAVQQRLLKSLNGDTLLFEETNTDLQLRFRYTWQSSERYGFVRRAELTNLGSESRSIDLVDGLSNFLPSGPDSRTQLHYSCLTDAYKLSELHSDKQLLIHRMAASLTDEPLPLESLEATTVWSFGWPESRILIQTDDCDRFLDDPDFEAPTSLRARRGAYFNAGRIELEANDTKSWTQVADIDQCQCDVAQLLQEMEDSTELRQSLERDIAEGIARLDGYLAASDGQQHGAEEIVATHHRANVLFNIMRGGVFPKDYEIRKSALSSHIKQHHRPLNTSEQAWLEALPDAFTLEELYERCADASESLERICREYLPLTFSRRHGDPSRPWNRFDIRTKDDRGEPILGFEGNWRDIFQNWEALAWSFPLYNEAFIRKFLNASTADGYNPYRITASGVEWECPDPDDPWASIGYWGDHQIIYLLKLLEFSVKQDASRLRASLGERSYVFAEVPYEIKSFARLTEDPNHSIHFNLERHRAILERAEHEGADGKLLHAESGSPLQASLLEKLLIPMAVKLSNYVPGGGIWLNTQRPEWNDANNALAGWGLSIVTTGYLHRYLEFLEQLLDSTDSSFECSETLGQLIATLDDAFATPPEDAEASPTARYELTEKLGLAGQAYREQVYARDIERRSTLESGSLLEFLRRARAHVRYCILRNRRPDGLYHAYNVLHLDAEARTVEIETLGPMLEGQVAVLSSGAINCTEGAQMLDALRESPLYCPKRRSYILYADKDLPAFLDFNRIDRQAAEAIPTLRIMLGRDDRSLVASSRDGCVRFRPALQNRYELEDALEALAKDPLYADSLREDRQPILDLYEKTFNHRSFTGRSGSMFAYEGLGSIYWHMVSKLMLAAQELALRADRCGEADSFDALYRHYYGIQNGLGFRKSAAEYGAFPADAYSHTPAHAGAQQPGLTGMVKEGILCRFGELGVELDDQCVRFAPRLLRAEEFLSRAETANIIRIGGEQQRIQLPPRSLLFTLAQTPVLYRLVESDEISLKVFCRDETVTTVNSHTLSPPLSLELLKRTGFIDRIEVSIPEPRLHG